MQEGTLSESITHAHRNPAWPDLQDMLANVELAIPPLWPLADFVAVNPFLGWTQRSFHETAAVLADLQGADILMPRDYFRQALEAGTIQPQDIEAACRQCADQEAENFQNLTADKLIQWLEDADNGPNPPAAARYRSFAELADQHAQTHWQPAIIESLSRICAAHYDQGQAVWQSPFKSQTLFAAWKQQAAVDPRLEKIGLKNFRQIVGDLPDTPAQAVAQLLGEFDVPPTHQQNFLLAELFSISGWASYIKYRVGKSELAGQSNADLVALLAMRLACDLAVSKLQLTDPDQTPWPKKRDGVSDFAIPPALAARYVLQVAGELAYRRTLLSDLKQPAALSPGRQSPAPIQMVFCIDVRSEIIRRHLEAAHRDLTTEGFAGFFGIPMTYIPLAHTHGSDQCPVLLEPTFKVCESASTAGRLAIWRKQFSQSAAKLWKQCQMTATSCFSFVESLGFAYTVNLLAKSFRRHSPKTNSKPLAFQHHLSLDQQCDLAEGILTNLSLRQNLGKLVVLCGHETDVVNNPYRASLDCGACGGHSGRANAALAVSILNDANVRQALVRRGLTIPESTCFLPAVHHTTTDEIELINIEDIPTSHTAELESLKNAIGAASPRARAERAVRMGPATGEDLLQRAADWSEVQPEWGLAGNAAFIVARREKTKHLDLAGRAFMHSYDHQQDKNLSVLELILTAPMVVANWINLQYYASCVDHEHFGSGSKLLHNVTGQIGVLSGNGGDLKTGLPWESIHDGKKPQHTPLRLLVIVEAPVSAIDTILHRHPHVASLVDHGWLNLVAWQDDRFFQRVEPNHWIPA